ncbi:MAG: type I pullulanase [Erysipelotrichaceae bacterium]
MRQQKYYEAYLDDFDKIIVYLSINSYDGKSSQFYLRNQKGLIQDLMIESIEHTQQNYQRFTLRLKEAIVIGEEYEVIHQHARSTILEYAYIVKQPLFDELYTYKGNDLGATYYKNHTSFALWAPTANRVKVEIKKGNMILSEEMLKSDFGVFRCEVHKDLENATYVYLVRVNGKWNEALDPYGIASNANHKCSAIVDRSKIKSKQYPLPELKSYCDAIIYEASVRDFTIQKNMGVSHPGTYLAFVEENEETKKKMTGFSYLKSLDITHVQLLPVLDFGSVDENYQDKFYNWGYDPVQYFCLEGSYASDANNPYSRILEFSKLVEECHKAGIRVNLDVVFNHVYDIDEVSINKVVPYYYFQMNEAGELSNGSFCGNDIDSTRSMAQKLIVDSCRFLCETYHIDGLRFDLMGILDCDTMNKVYNECSKLNPDFMVYGEGWDMPSLLDYRIRASIINDDKMEHVAQFSDRFRDVVKGRTSNNEVSVKGYVSGAYYLIDVMKNVLMASVNDEGGPKMFTKPTHVINYVECHDNMTSWDKLKECCKEDPREVRMQRHEMLLAATLLAQGIPFIHSGQEFARNKHQLANTYEDKDSINLIDYDRRNRYSRIVECFKALVQIRKKYDCFRYDTTQAVNDHVSFEDIEQKVLLYKIKDEKNDLIVVFNPSENAFNYNFKQEYCLLYDNGLQLGQKTKTTMFLPYHTYVFSLNH